MSRHAHHIQVKLTRSQANAVLDLIADELEFGDAEVEDRDSLSAAAKILSRGLVSLAARLNRMSA